MQHDQVKDEIVKQQGLLLLFRCSIEANLVERAKRLLWRIKHEDKLSCSHSNKELCHHIYERLLQDGYRVWLDHDQMHGAPMIAMANAIENSEYVLLCMSEAYKQSPYCQLEAIVTPFSDSVISFHLS